MPPVPIGRSNSYLPTFSGNVGCGTLAGCMCLQQKNAWSVACVAYRANHRKCARVTTRAPLRAAFVVLPKRGRGCYAARVTDPSAHSGTDNFRLEHGKCSM